MKWYKSKIGWAFVGVYFLYFFAVTVYMFACNSPWCGVEAVGYYSIPWNFLYPLLSKFEISYLIRDLVILVLVGVNIFAVYYFGYRLELNERRSMRK